MEVKNILQKPYQELDRLHFIVQNNHRLGYEIRETELALGAWGYTQEEIEEQQKQQRNREIDNKIKELQQMSIQDVLENNTENIKIYNDIISGLEAAKV